MCELRGQANASAKVAICICHVWRLTIIVNVTLALQSSSLTLCKFSSDKGHEAADTCLQSEFFSTIAVQHQRRTLCRQLLYMGDAHWKQWKHNGSKSFASSRWTVGIEALPLSMPPGLVRVSRWGHCIRRRQGQEKILACLTALP